MGIYDNGSKLLAEVVHGDVAGRADEDPLSQIHDEPPHEFCDGRGLPCPRRPVDERNVLCAQCKLYSLLLLGV